MSWFRKKDEGPPPRLPPGQWLTEDWPVLHHGEVPSIEPGSLRLRVWGEVEQPMELRLSDLMAAGSHTVVADMHCVTTWSKYDNRWTGLAAQRLLAMVRPTGRARFVVQHGEGGYTTNVALADFDRPENLLAWAHEPEPLTEEHGGPLRMVIPHLYAWKSTKWLVGIEFVASDRRGFWEERGYHNHADPFAEERYSHQE